MQPRCLFQMSTTRAYSTGMFCKTQNALGKLEAPVDLGVSTGTHLYERAPKTILASVTTTTPTNTMNTFYKNPAPLKDPEIPRTSVKEPRTPVKEPRTLVKEPRTSAEEPRTPGKESRTPGTLEIPKEPRTKLLQ